MYQVSLVALNDANRIRLVDGAREVFPGLRVHWVGGHTPGLQIVSVETARGRIVLTSDASRFKPLAAGIIQIA